MPKPAASPTPGPWRIVEHDSDAYVWPPIETRKRGCIAKVNLAGDGEPGERMANAKLIAAAPAMLEALRNLSHAFTSPEMQGEPLRLCQAELLAASRAIRQATGE